MLVHSAHMHENILSAYIQFINYFSRKLIEKEA